MGEQFGLDIILKKRNTDWAGCPVSFYEEIDSTNVKAKEDAAEGACHGTVIVADKQTAGRGRRGRSWSSPAGANLYFSLILRPELEPDKASMLTLVMGMAVAMAIRNICPVEAGIKWPNDIVVNGKKVCGILTEMGMTGRTIDYVVIGVGINVGKQDFAEEIRDVATSLEEQCGIAIDRAELLNEVLMHFELYYPMFMRCGNLSKLFGCYNELLVNAKREVRVLDPAGEYCGIALGINGLGELLVEKPDGEVTCVYAGEVSVRGIYGYV